MAPPKKDRSLYGSLYLYKNPYIKGGPGQEAKQRCSVLYGVIQCKERHTSNKNTHSDKHTHIDTQTAGRHISRTKTVRELQRGTYFCLSLLLLRLVRLVVGIEWTEELFLLEEWEEWEEWDKLVRDWPALWSNCMRQKIRSVGTSSNS